MNSNGVFSGNQPIISNVSAHQRSQTREPPAANWLLSCFGCLSAPHSELRYVDLQDLELKTPMQLRNIAAIIASGRFNLELVKSIAAALAEGKFGDDPQVLLGLANGLGKVKFIDRHSQKLIASAIEAGKFGSDVMVLQELAKTMAKINFAPRAAQLSIVHALLKQRFGSNPEVLKIVAQSLGELKVSDSNVQKGIAMVVMMQSFGTSPEVLYELAKAIGKLNFSDAEAQLCLASAIYYQKFANDNSVLCELVKSIDAIKFTDLESQNYLVEALLKNVFGGRLPLSLKPMLSKLIIDPDVYLKLQLSYPKLHHHLQFAVNYSEYNYSAACKPLLIPGLAMDLESCFSSENENVKFGYGTHGITYDSEGKPQLLLIYSEDLNPQQSNRAEILARCIGFLQAEYQFLYSENLAHIKVFDLQTSDNYPRKLDLGADSELFSAFPGWLQQAIVENQFNPEDYKSAHIINFILNFVAESLASNPELKNKCNNIIAKVISGQGNSFSLSSNSAYDAQIKNEINLAFNGDDNATFVSYTRKLQLFWQTLTTPHDKLQLAFLLGQLAKRGALGYHNETSNSANITFYSLSLQCIHWVIAENQELAEDLKLLLNSIAAHLEQGLCIEVETNNLLTAYAPVAAVWHKHA